MTKAQWGWEHYVLEQEIAFMRTQLVSAQTLAAKVAIKLVIKTLENDLYDHKLNYFDLVVTQ